MGTKQDLTKEENTKKEKGRLRRIYKDLDDKKKKSAEGLIEEAAFMRATLGELKEMIDENGPVDEMVQGDYKILREHPSVKIYNTMIQRYSTITKQLCDLLPKDIPKPKDDGFDEFINGRED